MSTAGVILLLLDACLLCAYLYYMYKCYGYFISPFNIVIFFFSLTIAIAPFFAFSDSGWKALNISSASDMSDYLNKSLYVNLIGMLVFILALFVLNYKRINAERLSRTENVLYRELLQLNTTWTNVITCLAIIAFISICIVYNDKSFPLLNGNRSFFYDKSISPIYQAICIAMNTLGLLHGARLIEGNKSAVIPFIGIVVCQLLSGARAGLILNVLAPLFVVFASKPKEHARRNKLVRKGAMIRTVAACLGLVVIGLEIQAIRSGEGIFSINESISEAMSGNTFSDIRDGAFLLKGFDEKLGGDLVLGKTYLAGIAALIPSSLLPFRQVWSWGRFSAYNLAGMIGTHFGLRGGWFLEGFINFNIIGIIIVAVLLAIIMWRIEIIYRKKMLESAEMGSCSASIVLLGLLSTLFSATYCTSSFADLYATIATVATLTIGSYVIRRRKERPQITTK